MPDFDPYHRWLGIPPDERPISKYRLLALGEYEGDPEVINAAAEGRTVFLRTLQAGEHAKLVAQLLNEVSQARVTLLDPEQKSDYDAQLRHERTPKEAEPAPAAAPIVQPAAPAVNLPAPPPRRTFSNVGPKHKRPVTKPIWKRPKVIGLSMAGLLVIATLLVMKVGSVSKTLPPSLQEGLFFERMSNTNEYSTHAARWTEYDVDAEDDLSISIWIRPETLMGRQILVAKENTKEIKKNCYPCYRLEINRKTLQICLMDRQGTQYTFTPKTGFSQSDPIKGWYHLFVSIDKSHPSASSLLINGINHSLNCKLDVDGGSNISGSLQNDGDVYVGAKRSSLGSPEDKFVGVIGLFRLFRRKLSDEEGKAIFRLDFQIATKYANSRL